MFWRTEVWKMQWVYFLWFIFGRTGAMQEVLSPSCPVIWMDLGLAVSIRHSVHRLRSLNTNGCTARLQCHVGALLWRKVHFRLQGSDHFLWLQEDALGSRFGTRVQYDKTWDISRPLRWMLICTTQKTDFLSVHSYLTEGNSPIGVLNL